MSLPVNAFQDGRFPGRDVNPGPIEYIAWVLSTQSQHRRVREKLKALGSSRNVLVVVDPGDFLPYSWSCFRFKALTNRLCGDDFLVSLPSQDWRTALIELYATDDSVVTAFCIRRPSRSPTIRRSVMIRITQNLLGPSAASWCENILLHSLAARASTHIKLLTI